MNRTVSMAHKNFGQIPTPGTLTEADMELRRRADEAFQMVGANLARSHFKAGITEAMRYVADANRYIAAQEPWKIAKEVKAGGAAAAEAEDRLATVLHTALQAVQDANTLMTPFMPNASQKIFEQLGGDGVWAAQPEIHEVVDDMPVAPVGAGVPAPGREYPVIMGDYASELASWQRHDSTPGTLLSKPQPIFQKLDPELGETGPEWAPVQH